MIDALVIRNGGGAVAPALSSLIALDYLLGSFEDVFVIQHTGQCSWFPSNDLHLTNVPDCGALHMTEHGIKQNLKDHHRGSDEAIDGLSFGLDLT